MSALYFRGKIAYAQRFASAPEDEPPIFVIAPGFGLVTPDWRLTPDRVSKLRRIKVDPRRPSYRKPLEAQARALAGRLAGSARVVLLGSIATGKYVDVLRPVFGDDLLFPVEFAGIGDMSRGALLLRAATSGIELEYGTLDSARHRKRLPRELTTTRVP